MGRIRRPTKRECTGVSLDCGHLQTSREALWTSRSRAFHLYTKSWSHLRVTALTSAPPRMCWPKGASPEKRTARCPGAGWVEPWVSLGPPRPSEASQGHACPNHQSSCSPAPEGPPLQVFSGSLLSSSLWSHGRPSAAVTSESGASPGVVQKSLVKPPHGGSARRRLLSNSPDRHAGSPASPGL